MKTGISLLCVFCVQALSVCAAESDSLSMKPLAPSWWLLSIHPLTALASGLKVEIEYKAERSRIGFLLSPELYYGSFSDSSQSEFIKPNKKSLDVQGWGGSASVRYYAADGLLRREIDGVPDALYVFASVEYRRFYLEYPTKAWVPFRENNADYYRLEDVHQSNSISQTGGSIGVGYMVFLFKGVFADAFVGYRGVRSVQHPQYIENVSYSDNVFSLRKTNLFAGLKVGIKL